MQCQTCGSACTRLSAGLRQRLTRGAAHYETIRAALGAPVLISADKTLKLYDRLAPGRDFSAIVMFKDPLYQLSSWRNVMVRKGREHDCGRFLDAYARVYAALVDAPISGRKCYLSTHAYQTEPEANLERICAFFDLAFDPAALRYWEHEHHAVGGNFHLGYKLETEGLGAMPVRDMRPARFDDELVALCANHQPSRDVHARLLALSEG